MPFRAPALTSSIDWGVLRQSAAAWPHTYPTGLGSPFPPKIDSYPTRSMAVPHALDFYTIVDDQLARCWRVRALDGLRT